MSHIKNVFNTWLLPSVAFTWAISTRRTKHRITCNDQFSNSEWAQDRVFASEMVDFKGMNSDKLRMMKAAASRRSVDFPRNSGQLLKNSAYHQNPQSERAWLFVFQAWRSTIPDRSSKGGVLRLSKQNFCMIRWHVDSLFHILHLQNAGNAESSAEKCSIHRTKFDENDPISSL